MAVPPWLLESPLKAGIGTMQSGAQLGASLRQQDIAQQEAADRMALSYAELQQRREQVAAQLAESLRQHQALQQYRQAEIAHQKQLEGQAAQQQALQALHWGQQNALQREDLQRKWAAENRMQGNADAAAQLKSGIDSDSAGFFKEYNADTDPASLIKKYPLASHDPTVRSVVAQHALTGRLKIRMGYKPTLEEQTIIDQLKPLYFERAKSGGGDPAQDALINTLQERLDAMEEERKAGAKSRLSFKDAANILTPEDQKAILDKTQSATKRLKWNPSTGDFE